MKELVPIRYGRMRQSPFAFYRGSARLMASDLSRTPNTGVQVQACGDCHLMNFGGFATPERNIIFDINQSESDLESKTDSLLADATLRGSRLVSKVSAYSSPGVGRAALRRLSFLNDLLPDIAEDRRLAGRQVSQARLLAEIRDLAFGL
jgi:uncharacterized protein DUF2252